MRGRDRHRRREAASATPVPLFMAALISNLFASSDAGAPFTYARASTAYVCDNEGIERLCLAGEARIWGGRRVRNLVPFSEKMDSAQWQKIACTVDADVTTAPDGTLTADFLNETAAAASHVIRPQDIACVAGNQYLYSVSVKRKPGSRRFAAVVLANLFATVQGAVVDLDTGEVSNWTAAANAIAIGAIPEKDGWWRVWALATATTTGTGGQFFVYASQDGVYANRAYLGAVGEGVYVWGAQLENVTGQSVQTPSEYVSNGVLPAPYHGISNTLDGIKVFPTVRMHYENLLAQSENQTTGGWLAIGNVSIVSQDEIVFGGVGNVATDRLSVSYGPPVGFRAGRQIRLQMWLPPAELWTDPTVSISIQDSFTGGAVGGVPLPGEYRLVTYTATLPGSATGGFATAFIISDKASTVSERLRVSAQDVTGANIFPDYVITGGAPLVIDSGKTAPIPAPVLRRYFREPAGTQLVTPTASIRDLSNAAWVSSGGASTASRTIPGVDGVLSSASRLTATGANAVRMQAALVLAAANRVFSCYMRRVAGAGAIQMTGDGGATWQTVTVSAQWGRVGILTAVLNPQVGFRVVTANDAIDVDFAQFEPVVSGLSPGAQAYTSPMDTSGTNVRAKDVLTYPAAGNVVGTLGGAFVCAYPYTTAANAGGLVDGNPNELVASGSVGARGLIRDGTALVQSSGGVAWAGAGIGKKFASAWGGGTMSVNCTGGTLGTGAFDGNMNPLSLRIGENGSTTAEMVGSLGDIAIYDIKPTDAQLNSWVA